MGNTKKQTSRRDLGMKIFLAITAVILVVVLLGSLLGSSGLLLRMTTPLSSANYKVDGAMLTYFYRTTYYSRSTRWAIMCPMLASIPPNPSKARLTWTASKPGMTTCCPPRPNRPSRCWFWPKQPGKRNLPHR